MPSEYLLLRRDEYTRVYTTVYPRVHNSIHACTQVRSKFPRALPFPCPSSPLLRSNKVGIPSQPKHPDQGYENALHQRAKTIIPRALLRSYRERYCDHTESPLALLPRALLRSYREREGALTESVEAILLRAQKTSYGARNRRVRSSASKAPEGDSSEMPSFSPHHQSSPRL